VAQVSLTILIWQQNMMPESILLHAVRMAPRIALCNARLAQPGCLRVHSLGAQSTALGPGGYRIACMQMAQGCALGQTDTGLLAWAPAGCTPGGKLDKPAVTSAVAVHNAAVAA